MANQILPKYTAGTALTITLASLATSSVGVGQQSTIVDNSTTRYQRIYLFVNVKLGTSPTVNALVSVFVLRSDGTVRTDGAGASDAAFTAKNAQTLGSLTTGPSAATGDVLKDCYVIENPGKEWGVAVVNGSGVALNSTGGNHSITWIGEDPEIQ